MSTGQLFFFASKATPHSKPYFKNASTTFDKLVNNKLKETSSNYDNKQNFLKDVLKEWENIKNDEPH